MCLSTKVYHSCNNEFYSYSRVHRLHVLGDRCNPSQTIIFTVPKRRNMLGYHNHLVLVSPSVDLGAVILKIVDTVTIIALTLKWKTHHKLIYGQQEKQQNERPSGMYSVIVVLAGVLPITSLSFDLA